MHKRAISNKYYSCATKGRCFVGMVVPSLPPSQVLIITQDSWFDVIVVANNDFRKIPNGMEIMLAQFHHTILQAGLNY